MSEEEVAKPADLLDGGSLDDLLPALPTHPSKIDSMVVRKQILGLSRAPFRMAMTRILEAEPDAAKMAQFAARNPDRWGQLVAIFGRLSGYHERLELEAPPEAAAKEMGMAQLMQAISDMDRKLAQSGVYATPIEGKEEPQVEKLTIDASLPAAQVEE